MFPPSYLVWFWFWTQSGMQIGLLYTHFLVKTYCQSPVSSYRSYQSQRMLLLYTVAKGGHCVYVCVCVCVFDMFVNNSSNNAIYFLGGGETERGTARLLWQVKELF